MHESLRGDTCNCCLWLTGECLFVIQHLDLMWYIELRYFNGKRTGFFCFWISSRKSHWKECFALGDRAGNLFRLNRFIDTDFRLPILEGMNRERIKSSLKQLDRPVCNHDLTIIGVLFYLSFPFRLRQEHWYLESSKIVRSFADNLDFCHRDATCRVRHQWSWLPDWGTVIAELEVYLKNEMQN